MKRILNLIVFSSLICVGYLVADERSDWFAERYEWIERARKEKDRSNIPQLSRIVLGVGRNLERSSPDAVELFHQAKMELLSIPGHAEYYRDRINSTRGDLEEALAAGEINLIGSVRARLSNDVMYGFQTLAHLPSPETVGVLGEFLFDERGYVDISGLPPSEMSLYEGVKDSPVYAHAARTLDALPIVAKPVEAKTYYRAPADTEPWRQWYREIRDGKRTFRFEGDPAEYDLNGPVPGRKLERIARDGKRDRERAAGRSGPDPRGAPAADASVESPSGPPYIAWIAAGALVLGTLVWHRWRRRVSGRS